MQNAPPPLPEDEPSRSAQPAPRPILTPQLKAAFISKLLPGAGQIYNGQKGKGCLLMLIILATMGLGVYWVLSSFVSVVSSVTNLEEPPDTFATVLKGTIAIGVCIGLWVYSIWDAYTVARGKKPS